MINTIYLSGASVCLDDEGLGWRKIAKAMFSDISYDCFLPNQYFNYSTLPPSTDKECMNYFLYRLKHSKLVVVNLQHTKKSVGTGMELALAHEWGIPIIGFNKDDTSYPWSVELCDVILDDLKEVVDYIQIYY